MERSRKNALAFLETLVSPGSFTIRPIGYLTISNIQLLGLNFGGGKKGNDGEPLPLTPAEQRRQRRQRRHVHAFLFLQAAPLPEVSRAIRAHEKLLDAETPAEDAFDAFMAGHVDPWLAVIPPEGIAAAYEQLAQLDEIDAAVVTAAPPDAQKKSGPE